MLKFDGKIVQFGFGAVGKSFFEKIKKELKFDENNYYVISRDKNEFSAYINLGGMTLNFITCEVNINNYKEIFGKYLGSGDLLIDFAESVGTTDICDWCAENNIMYINTGETDWPDIWYSIFDEHEKKCNLKLKYKNNKTLNKCPIVLHHGNNPGLVSHFVKAGIEYIINKQFRKNTKLNTLLKENKFNEIAYELGIKMIHVNDIDLQKVSDEYKKDKLYSTWCIDSFFFEMLSEATMNIGKTENINFENECNKIDFEKGYVEFRNIAVDKKCNTYYPGGNFEGFLVPHEETITIAKNLEVKKDGDVVYRPSVMFIYSPCEYAKRYMDDSKVNEYPVPNPEKPQDCENKDGISIVRGYIYPKFAEIIYKEKIEEGNEYVGVLIMGDKFNPVWVGNRIENQFLYKSKKDSYWQTPTITPVSMSALSAVCWMIKNKDKGGIYFPDDINDYKYILKKAEKYISKTIYKTFDKKEIEENLKVNFNNHNIKDYFV